jgi:sugar-specific transcriptional regulator TrmB
VQIGERIETLMRLGLTLNQARAYLALVYSGPVGARELAKKSNITRQDIYRVMPSLEEAGIVEKILGLPSIYEAISMQQGISILLKRKVAEQKNLQRKTTKMLLDFKNHPEEKKTAVDPHFTLVPGKEIFIQKLKEKLQTTQKSICIITSKNRFSASIVELAQEYNKALKRGIKIKIATEKHMPEEEALEELQNLTKNRNFLVKYFVDSPPAIVAIYDNDEAYITMSAEAKFSQTSTLWSKNRCFLALAQCYFEGKWRDAR